jgi:hypothetical protein
MNNLAELCSKLADALDGMPYKYGSLSLEEELALAELIGRARNLVAKEGALASSEVHVDAARYRWIKAQRNLELHTCKMYGVPWTNVETGKKYYPTHYLAANGTGFGGIENLDDLIDQAMELYPSKGQ